MPKSTLEYIAALGRISCFEIKCPGKEFVLRGRPLVGPKWRRLYAIATQRLRAIERSIGRVE